MKALRGVAAVVLVGSLAACGGSHRVTTSKSSAPPPLPRIKPSSLALVLPASAAGPTTCTVYEAGYATQVVFVSRSLNVTGECQAWSSRQPGAGYLWAYQPTSAAIASTGVSICDLKDPSGRVSATVVEDNAWTPISSVQRQAISTACTSLASAGWIGGHHRSAG